MQAFSFPGNWATETRFRARSLPGVKQKTLAPAEESASCCRVSSQKWLTIQPGTGDAAGCPWKASQLFSQINKAERPTSCVLMATRSLQEHAMPLPVPWAAQAQDVSAGWQRCLLSHSPGFSLYNLSQTLALCQASISNPGWPPTC